MADEVPRDYATWKPKTVAGVKKAEKDSGFLWGINPSTGESYTDADRLSYARKRLALDKGKYSDSDIKWLMTTAYAWGLDPSKREIYLVTHGYKPTIVVGYQVYLKRTASYCDGWFVEAFHLRTVEGKIEEEPIDGTMLKDRNYLNGCVVRVKIRRQRFQGELFTWEAMFSECVPPTWKPDGNGMWNHRPIFMLKKNALSQAFRLCFADIIGGLPYAAEELGEIVEQEIPAGGVSDWLKEGDAPK